ncbi:hypothetical protein FQN60_015392 [Etheostoma spectabile]|uniref:Uncharacterized protein n=1 Tax=Etheostoma spectabile TaxID=54343 RepID=A0A5J5CQE5_9PERO|nr:hypothetical protein FQN60_015392 [Etheostoma spectabile]
MINSVDFFQKNGSTLKTLSERTRKPTPANHFVCERAHVRLIGGDQLLKCISLILHAEARPQKDTEAQRQPLGSVGTLKPLRKKREGREERRRQRQERRRGVKETGTEKLKAKEQRGTAIRVISEESTVADDSQKYSSDPQAS